MYRQTDVQIYIQTNRNKDVQTYTDKQTDRRTVQKYWNKLKNRQMYRKTDIHTYKVLYIRQTYRQTDRQDRQKKLQTGQQTDRQAVNECCVKKSGQNEQYYKSLRHVPL